MVSSLNCAHAFITIQTIIMYYSFLKDFLIIAFIYENIFLFHIKEKNIYISIFIISIFSKVYFIKVNFALEQHCCCRLDVLKEKKAIEYFQYFFKNDTHTSHALYIYIKFYAALQNTLILLC